MLTKEECMEALDHIWYCGNESEIALLEQLIEEHFKLIKCDLDCKNCWKFKFVDRCNNQPLKFEELKEGMWVWDNKRKLYYKLSCVYKDNGILVTDGFLNKFILYEENRFYRKQVDE